MKKVFHININPNRIFGLDILRAFAILFVVIGHGGLLLPEKAESISSIFVFDGVSIFFVLSGFLIGGILINTLETDNLNRFTLIEFWIKRWFRTLPNYLLVLSLLIIVNLVFNKNFPTIPVNKYLIFSQNIFSPHPEFFPEAWSLCVEEWFYLIIPFASYLLIRAVGTSARISVLLVAITTILSVTFFRYLRLEHLQEVNGNDWDLLFRKQVCTRLDSLMYGVIGAYINFYHTKKWNKYKHILLIGGILSFIVIKLISVDLLQVSMFYQCVFSFSFISIATLMLLPFLNGIKSGKGILYKTITIISLISYSMYLLNLSIVQNLIVNRIEWSYLTDSSNAIAYTKYGAYWVLLVAFSILLYKYFEIPMTNLRNSEKIKGFFTNKKDAAQLQESKP